MKKMSQVVVTIILLSGFGILALGSGNSNTSGEINQGEGNVDGVIDDTALGDCSIEIKSCRLAKDYEGENVVIVSYGYTNHSDTPTAFNIAVSDNVYQDGVGLNKSYVLEENAAYNSENQSKEIKKDVTLEVEVAYKLNNTTSDITVEVKEFISFNKKVISKSFKITQ